MGVHNIVNVNQHRPYKRLLTMSAIDRRSAPAFSINENFAKKYEEKKRREELSQLQEKYGADYDPEDEDYESDESTVYSSEDSDAEFVTPEVDAAILKIIGKIRKGDQEIYSAEGKDFFQEEEERLAQIAAAGTSNSSKKAQKGKKEKAINLKDYQRKALLATGGQGYSDEEGDNSVNAFRTPAQEEEDLRQETKAAFLNAVNGEDPDDEGDGVDAQDLLVRRDAQDDSDDDEDRYRKFLLDNVGQDELDRALAIKRENEKAAKSSSGEVEGSGKKAKKAAAAAPAEDDDFLKNYILNRGWLDKKSKHIPSYKEITTAPEASTSGTSGYTPSGTNAINLLDDDSEEEFEKAEEFETNYNFRFEEEAGGEIQTHARDLTTSIRRVDDSRKKERESRAARKAEEKQQKMEELKRLKSLKKQEIMEKIDKIKEIAGEVEGFDYSALDLEGEYDPDKHKNVMSKVFNEKYYDEAETDANGKPVWDDDIDIDDIVPDFDKHDEAYAPGGEAYDPTASGESGKKSRADRKKDKKKKKKKKKKKGKERAEDQDGEYERHDSHDASYAAGSGAAHTNGNAVDLDPKELDAIADPAERRKMVEQYMDELYKLDYEDMIGDLPTRFHSPTSALNKRRNARR